MTRKVYNKCKNTYCKDINTHIYHIEVYDGTYFHPYKDSIEWEEEYIKINYPEQYTNNNELEVKVRTIRIPYNYIKRIVMYNNGKYL